MGSVAGLVWIKLSRCVCNDFIIFLQYASQPLVRGVAKYYKVFYSFWERQIGALALHNNYFNFWKDDSSLPPQLNFLSFWVSARRGLAILENFFMKLR